MGVSRSAVLVTAYLMIFHHMTILEALLALRKKRAVCPNESFLKQLRDLNEVLLEERDDDERSETLSQSSVIDALAPRRPESIMGAQVHSILVEEQDGASVVSTCVTSREGQVPSLPGERAEEGGDEEDVERMVKEWQQRNEKYQNEDWWQAQLMCEDEESLPGGKRRSLPEDLESVTSADVRAVTDGIRRNYAESVSSVTTDTSSCADIWKQRLKEIEEQAAARYKGRGQEDDESESGGGAGGEDDTESLISESGSLYNFCKKNKDSLTPLERWRVKRIQFGWNKKDAEAEKGAGGEGGEGEAQGAKAPALEDVNLTAYQSWKLRQQKKLGGEDKDAVVELSRAQDPAVARRRQRREEVLERSRRTLEESQSSCGWETESTVSASTIPLSAFFQLASAQSPGPDDSASVISSRSARSSVSRARSTRSSATAPPQAPLTPIVPLPGQGNEAVDLLSIQNWIANVVTETLIQKQGELLMGGGSLPPSRAGSVLSLGAASAIPGRPMEDDKASMLSGASYSTGLSRGAGESVLSGGGTSSYSGYGSRRAKITKTSVPLCSLFQDQVDLRKLDSMDKEMKLEMRGKMASYELQKIASDNKRSTLFKKKKKEAESDEEAEDDSEATPKGTSKYPTRVSDPDPTRVSTRDLTYGTTRALNRISTRDSTNTPTRFSACNPTPEVTRISTRDLGPDSARDLTPRISSRDPAVDRWDRPSAGSAGRFSSSAAERDKVSSIDKWLSDISAPPRYPQPDRAVPGEETSESEYDFSSRRRASESSFQSEEEYASSTAADEDVSSCSFRGNDGDPTSEVPYHSRKFPSARDPLSNGLKESQSYREPRRYTSEEEEEEEAERGYAVRRTFPRYQDGQSEPRRGGREEEEEEVSSFINRCRQRSKMQVEEELDEDDVIGAWRRQQEAKRRAAYKDSDS